MMETYIWNNCREAYVYNDDQFRMKFGDNLEFVAGPTSAPLRTFTLKYESLYFATTWNGSAWVKNTVELPNMNAFLLDEFYQRHRLNKRFIYPSPLFGDRIVRFAEPLSMPPGIARGRGWLEGLEVKLKESPL